MRALVVYESMFGNTREVAEAIAAGLGEDPRIEGVTLAETNKAPASVADYDLVLIGGPIHAWSMTRASTREGARDEARRDGVDTESKGDGIREWLDGLGEVEHETRAATFDTAVDTRWPTGSAAKPAAKRLDKRGFTLIAPPEHFLVEAKLGPLVKGELERARSWTRDLLSSAQLSPGP